MNMDEKKDIAYRIYQAKARVCVFDLLYESGLRYGELKPILDEYVEEKILATEDGKYYSFIGDGRMFSGKYKKDQVIRHTNAPIKRSVNEEWDRETPADDDTMEEKIAFLAACRKKLVEEMQADLEAADAENETEDDDDDEVSFDANALSDARSAQKIMMGGSYVEPEDKENRSQTNGDPPDEETSPELSDISLELNESVSIKVDSDEIFLVPQGLELCGKSIRFKILTQNESVYLSDNGATLPFLLVRVPYQEQKIEEQINSLAEHYDVSIVGDELRIRLESPDRVMASLLKLFAAMERIGAIGEGIVKKENPLYIKALATVIREGKASLSLLACRCHIPYVYAGKIFQWMQDMKYISASFEEGGHRVLITEKEFIEKYGPFE